MMGWKQVQSPAAAGPLVGNCGHAQGSLTARQLLMRSLLNRNYSFFLNIISQCFLHVQTPTSSPECVLSVFQVIYRALTPSNKIEDPYSPEAQDLLKLTNLRLLLLKRQECPCRGLGLVEKPQRFAHYAIYDLIIRGSCFCNGHAEECELANRTGEVENVVSLWHSLI